MKRNIDHLRCNCSVVIITSYFGNKVIVAIKVIMETKGVVRKTKEQIQNIPLSTVGALSSLHLNLLIELPNLYLYILVPEWLFTYLKRLPYMPSLNHWQAKLVEKFDVKRCFR